MKTKMTRRWLLATAALTCLALTIQGQNSITNDQGLIPGTDAYQEAKVQGLLPTTVPTLHGDHADNAVQASTKAFTAKNNNCLIPFDPDTWTPFPANDDGSIGISLDFDFDFYGDIFNFVFLNNNGNLTFNSALSAFSAASFPIATPMIAPFWSDVDTRGGVSGLAWFLSTPTALYVYWDNVGYFNQQTDKVNTFQVIITDGTDPVIGIGNNVAFYYGDMEWTTGSASQGVNGFGGIAATVGANKGDATNFFQIGRFSNPGSSFFSNTSTENGVSWLDDQCFLFDLSGAENFPPFLQSITSTSVSSCPDEVAQVNFAFTGPEAGQVVELALVNDGGTDANLESNTIGGTTFGNLFVSADQPGSYTITILATDDGTPPESTLLTITLTVNPCIPDCLGEPDGEALPGTACTTALDEIGIFNEDCVCLAFDCAGVAGGDSEVDLCGQCIAGGDSNPLWNASCTDCLGIPNGFAIPGTPCITVDLEEGIFDEFCICIPNTCSGLRTFLSNYNGTGGSDIYEVDLDDLNLTATLNLIASVPYRASLAYNDADNLLYLVNESNASYQTLDPDLGAGSLSSAVTTGFSFTGFTGATFGPDGQLYVASSALGMILSYNVATNQGSVYSSAQVFAGDIAFGNNQLLYMTSAAPNRAFVILPNTNNVTLGPIFNGAAGIALTANNNFLTSYQGGSSLVLSNNLATNLNASYNLLLNGVSFTLNDGDLASGCFAEASELVAPEAVTAVELVSHLQSQPNPTTGHSVAIFTPEYEGRSVLEVYDLSGRLVATLFNQVVEEGQEYRIAFDGTRLPNGIYLYRLTSEREVLINKFIISR